MEQNHKFLSDISLKKVNEKNRILFEDERKNKIKLSSIENNHYAFLSEIKHLPEFNRKNKFTSFHKFGKNELFRISEYPEIRHKEKNNNNNYYINYVNNIFENDSIRNSRKHHNLLFHDNQTPSNRKKKHHNNHLSDIKIQSAKKNFEILYDHYTIMSQNKKKQINPIIDNKNETSILNINKNIKIKEFKYEETKNVEEEIKTKKNDNKEKKEENNGKTNINIYNIKQDKKKVNKTIFNTCFCCLTSTNDSSFENE